MCSIPPYIPLYLLILFGGKLANIDIPANRSNPAYFLASAKLNFILTNVKYCFCYTIGSDLGDCVALWTSLFYVMYHFILNLINGYSKCCYRFIKKSFVSLYNVVNSFFISLK